jgi:hypothetical protein
MKSWLPLSLLAASAAIVRLLIYAWLAVPFGGLTRAICVYDCGWYVRLAAEGYGSNGDWAPLGPVPNWAFFPLFPMLLRLFLPFGMGAIWAGLLVAGLLFVAFATVGALYLARTRPAADPVMWLLFLSVFPFGFIFSVPYSEGLFAALMLASLVALSDRRLLLAGALVGLMTASRPTGVIMLPLIIISCAQHVRQNLHRRDRLTLLGEALLPIAIAPLGLSLYMVYQYWDMGDALAFNHVQLLWDRSWTGAHVQFLHAISVFDWPRMADFKGRASENYNALWVVIGLGMAIRLGLQRRWVETYLLTVCILLPLSSAIHSLPRFVATNPIFLVALFDLVAKIRNNHSVIALYALCGMLQAAIILGWYQEWNALF